MRYEYCYFVAVFDATTPVKVNEYAKKGWRFMFVVGNVYWFERPVDGKAKVDPSAKAQDDKTTPKPLLKTGGELAGAAGNKPPVKKAVVKKK